MASDLGFWRLLEGVDAVQSHAALKKLRLISLPQSKQPPHMRHAIPDGRGERERERERERKREGGEKEREKVR